MFRSNVSIEMMIYECLILMLMLCKSSYAKLTPEVLHIWCAMDKYSEHREYQR